jgi:hypothetical protein
MQRLTDGMPRKPNNTTREHLPTNTLALLSLIFGLLFFIPFAPLVAIILGIIALHQLKRIRQKGRGMAIAGIILGCFWIVAWIILVALFTSVLIAMLSSLMRGY